MPKKANPAFSLGINPILVKIIIKEEMEKRNWTNYRLSKESGVSQSTVSDHFNEEKNVIPSNDSISRYCQALGISPVDLVIRVNYYRSKEGEMLPLLWETIEKLERRDRMELTEYAGKLLNRKEYLKAHGIYDDDDDD